MGKLVKHTVPERFVADTRKGATLEFTRREAFLSYLYEAREGILQLENEYMRKNYFFNKPLSKWLAYNLGKFEKLKSAPKLL